MVLFLDHYCCCGCDYLYSFSVKWVILIWCVKRGAHFPSELHLKRMLGACGLLEVHRSCFMDLGIFSDLLLGAGSITVRSCGNLFYSGGGCTINYDSRSFDVLLVYGMGYSYVILDFLVLEFCR